MGAIVSITEAKARLNELVRQAQDENIALARHGKPIALLVSVERYEDLLEEIEDLKDRLALREAEPADLNIPLAKVRVELGL